jgi:hypothetical protein
MVERLRARAVVGASFRDCGPRLTVSRADHDDLHVLALRVLRAHQEHFTHIAREHPLNCSPPRTLTRRRVCSLVVRRAVSELGLDPLTNEEKQLLCRWDEGLE